MLEAPELRAKVCALDAADKELRRLNRLLLTQGIDRARLMPGRAWEDITRLRGQRARRLIAARLAGQTLHTSDMLRELQDL
jgi:hypothetical protein